MKKKRKNFRFVCSFRFSPELTSEEARNNLIAKIPIIEGMTVETKSTGVFRIIFNCYRFNLRAITKKFIKDNDLQNEDFRVFDENYIEIFNEQTLNKKY